jgi:hypothetical protein
MGGVICPEMPHTETEPSEIVLEEEIKKLNGQKFTDPKFAHTRDKPWKRVTTFIEDPVLMADGVGAGDICQGGLGDCWYLGALSVMATREDLLGLSFCTADGEKEAVYKFRFYKHGKWTDVLIDDFIPVNSPNLPCRPEYAKGKEENETWVMLMEKAYAKLHGSYKALEGGFVDDALIDMTAGFHLSCNLESDEKKKDVESGEFWNEFLDMFESGSYLMGCAMGGNGGREVDQGLGILSGHAYGILDVREQDGLKMVKVRNPWGSTEWKGKYSDEDDFWKSEANLKKWDHSLADDGTFWMCYDDFVTHYKRIYICRIPPADMPSQCFAGEWKGKTAVGCSNNPLWYKNPQFVFTVPEDDFDMIFSLSCPDSRMPGYSKCDVAKSFTLFKLPAGATAVNDDDQAEKILSPIHNYSRDNAAEITLDKGTYAIMPMTFDQGVEMEFWLRIYSEKEIEIKSSEGTAGYPDTMVMPVILPGGGSRTQVNRKKKKGPSNDSVSKNKKKRNGGRIVGGVAVLPIVVPPRPPKDDDGGLEIARRLAGLPAAMAGACCTHCWSTTTRCCFWFEVPVVSVKFALLVLLLNIVLSGVGSIVCGIREIRLSCHFSNYTARYGVKTLIAGILQLLFFWTIIGYVLSVIHGIRILRTAIIHRRW